MNEIISQPKFMNYVRHYREKGLSEVTKFAALSAYSEYQQGNKNLLIQKMESAFGRDIEDQHFLWGEGVVPSSTLDEEYEYRKSGKSGTGFSGVDLTSDKIIEQVLDPIHNQGNKTETFKTAYLKGFKFCVLDCRVHGESIHRANVYIKRNVGQPIKSKYQGYCLYCYAKQRGSKEKRIAAIKTMHEKFFAKIAKLEGEPCQSE